MNVGELKQLLKNVPDHYEVYDCASGFAVIDVDINDGHEDVDLITEDL